VSKTKKKQEEIEKGNEKDFIDFVSSAIRAPRQGAYEHILSQFLAQAVICTDPLKRIKVVTEAALMIPGSERKNLAIDYGKVEIFRSITTALLNRVTRYSGDPDKNPIEMVSCSWGFLESEENFDKFISPWFNYQLYYLPEFIVDHKEQTDRMAYCCRRCGQFLAEEKISNSPKLPRRCPRCNASVRSSLSSFERPLKIRRQRIVENPFWSFFFEASHCLELEGYNAMVNNFADWAIPQVQLFLAELTRVVSPSLYSEILGLYTGPRRKSYAEKVKEVAEVPREDEDSLDPGL
jgi:phage FluMu protein Com